MCVGNLDSAAHGDGRRLPGNGGDGDGAHLVVQAIVVAVVDDKVEDVRDGLVARLQRRDVSEQDIEIVSSRITVGGNRIPFGVNHFYDIIKDNSRWRLGGHLMVPRLMSSMEKVEYSLSSCASCWSGVLVSMP